MSLLNRDIIARAVLLGMLIALMGISTRPHQVDQAMIRVWQTLGSGNSSHTATNLGIAAEHLPWWSGLWLYAGRYASQAGDPEATIKYITRYGAIQDLAYEDQLLLGDAYQDLGQLESAEQTWQLAVLSPTSSADVHYRLANIHRLQENIPALIRELKSIFSLQPNNAQVAYELGLLLSTQDPESALAYLEEAAQQDPKYGESAVELQRKIITARLEEEPAYTLVEVGRTLAAMEEWQLAAQAFSQATKIRADYSEAWAFLGEVQQHLPPGLSVFDLDSLTCLETALQLNPRSVAGNVFLGIYWQRQNQYEKAMNYIRTASNLDPVNPMLQAELGRVMARTGDLDGAKIKYERAIELAPREPMYWRLLGDFSMHYQYEIRQIALPAARQSMILSPDDPQSLDFMAQALIMLGDDLNAERYLRSALAEDSQYAPAYMHLGIIYMSQGKVDLAHSQFARAKEIAPDEQTLEQAERLIGYYFP